MHGGALDADPRLKLVRLLLSPLELEVAQLSRLGFSRTAVAAALGISPGTVRVVLRLVRWKLGPGWQRNGDYAWPEDEVRPLAGVRRSGAAGEDGAGQAEAGAPVAGGAAAGAALELGRLEFTGLQRFWLKPVLDRLVEERALKLLTARSEGAFAPPWLPLVYHRRLIRSAVYRIGDPEAVFAEMAGFVETGLPERAAWVLERIETAKSLRAPWRKPELPGRDEVAALLREAFGEAGERAADRALGASAAKRDEAGKTVTVVVE